MALCYDVSRHRF